MKWFRIAALASFISCLLLITLSSVRSQDNDRSISQLRKNARQAFKDGNYKDAYAIYQKLCLNPDNDSKNIHVDLSQSLISLRELSRMSDYDEFLESIVTAHPKSWRWKSAISGEYINLNHFGYMITGEFQRGQHRGGGKQMFSGARDRVRALQLMLEAIDLSQEQDLRGREIAYLYIALAEQLLNNRDSRESWRLQTLTDLTKLPDYDSNYPYSPSLIAAPVDDADNPVFYHVPESWQRASSDGERWRWAHAQAVKLPPSLRNRILHHQAIFYQQQFGVESMRQYGHYFGGLKTTDNEKDTSGTYALHTLKESETIAKLATGIRRFSLPDEFNHIELFHKIVDSEDKSYKESALDNLAGVFENRRQFPRAAEIWRKSIRDHGPGHLKYKQKRLDQIVNKWGRFESVMSQPAGRGATVEYRFRNGRKLQLKATQIKIDRLLTDAKSYIRSKPRKFDGNRINISNIGHRLVWNNEKKYLDISARRLLLGKCSLNLVKIILIAGSPSALRYKKQELIC